MVRSPASGEDTIAEPSPGADQFSEPKNLEVIMVRSAPSPTPINSSPSHL